MNIKLPKIKMFMQNTETDSSLEIHEALKQSVVNLSFGSALGYISNLKNTSWSLSLNINILVLAKIIIIFFLIKE